MMIKVAFTDGCVGSWSTGCDDNGDNCAYKATWMVLGDISSVFFVVEARTTGWVGIGFSRNDRMVLTALQVLTTYKPSIFCPCMMLLSCCMTTEVITLD